MSDKASIIKEAQKYLAKGQLDKAIGEWEKLLQTSPDANSFNTVGDLYIKKGDKLKAAESFHKAAQMFRTEGFSLKALALYKKILNFLPSDAKSLYALGELNEEKNILTDAIKYYLAAGDYFLKSERKSDAVNTYLKIVNLAPGNLALREKIAGLFLKEGFPEETSGEFVSIAELYEAQGKPEEARTYLERAVELKPSNGKALSMLAAVLEKAGEFEKAFQCVKTAVDRTGHHKDLVAALVRLAIRAGHLVHAKEYANMLLATDPNNMDARKALAEAAFRGGSLEEAWKQFIPVIDELILDNCAEALEILGRFKDIEPVEARRKLVGYYMQKGNTGAALVELKELGEILAGSGMDQEAINCYKEARTLAPDDPVVLEALERLETVETTASSEPREKTPEEVIMEANTFIGYGLMEEAKKTLEELRVRTPEKIEVHDRLKTVYLALGEKGQAITECIILARLYELAAEGIKREAIINEAFTLDPEDPRLLARFGDRTIGKKTTQGPAEPAAADAEPAAADAGPAAADAEPAATGTEPVATGAGPSATSAEGAPAHADTDSEAGGKLTEEYEEELSEADFYANQGLFDNAAQIYQRLIERFPQVEELHSRYLSLNEMRAQGAAMDPLRVEGLAEDAPLSQSSGALNIEEVMGSEEASPALDSDVRGIFEEFKKGLEKELEGADPDTHYNLGIAYKEMGLLEDSIREFQKSQKDPGYHIQSTTMLGVCYMAKGLYPLAIENLRAAIAGIEVKDEAYWGLSFDLAEALSKNGDEAEAYKIYMDLYGWNSRFRGVAERLAAMREQMEADKPAPAAKTKKPGDDKQKKNRVSYI